MLDSFSFVLSLEIVLNSTFLFLLPFPSSSSHLEVNMKHFLSGLVKIKVKMLNTESQTCSVSNNTDVYFSAFLNSVGMEASSDPPHNSGIQPN